MYLYTNEGQLNYMRLCGIRKTDTPSLYLRLCFDFLENFVRVHN